MALTWEFNVLTMPAIAEGTVYPLRLVKLGTAVSGVVAATDGAGAHGDRVLGVVRGNVGDASIAAGINCDVMVYGVAKVLSGAAITARGDLLKSDSAGKAIIANVADDLVFGWALNTTVGADEVVEVLLAPSRI